MRGCFSPNPKCSRKIHFCSRWYYPDSQPLSASECHYFFGTDPKLKYFALLILSLVICRTLLLNECWGFVCKLIAVSLTEICNGSGVFPARLHSVLHEAIFCIFYDLLYLNQIPRNENLLFVFLRSWILNYFSLHYCFCDNACDLYARNYLRHYPSWQHFLRTRWGVGFQGCYNDCDGFFSSIKSFSWWKFQIICPVCEYFGELWIISWVGGFVFPADRFLCFSSEFLLIIFWATGWGASLLQLVLILNPFHIIFIVRDCLLCFPSLSCILPLLPYNLLSHFLSLLSGYLPLFCIIEVHHISFEDIQAKWWVLRFCWPTFFSGFSILHFLFPVFR